jgi:hypothetical protein
LEVLHCHVSMALVPIDQTEGELTYALLSCGDGTIPRYLFCQGSAVRVPPHALEQFDSDDVARQAIANRYGPSFEHVHGFGESPGPVETP